jgi:hypothetical protein
MLFSLNFALKGITPVKLCYFHWTLPWRE